MGNLSIWWKRYYGFMIIPFIVMTVLFNNLSKYSKIAYFLFIAWIIFNLIDFYRKEIAGDSKKQQ
ncbi:hypothetical protein EC917_12478 [Bacillus thuringiensis]|uniref:Uncharacterized protein n=1 Tax=Bacillus thuringiensis TaxID=1428 RepID=A0A4R4B2D5_BACTU|nr:hypothetical protein [Bacillus thuringiensis]TCW47606.1 hypothetical protein EC917_12478 [Bacillus thuringiensis]TCW47762.1 hypothetical protein EC910_12378 [Bacillus thuringiensis]